jgi:hypothetical protein
MLEDLAEDERQQQENEPDACYGEEDSKRVEGRK